MSKSAITLLLIAVLMITATGCERYFLIQDPAGAKEYYTSAVEEQPSGAVRFNDLKTGARVTLQSSSVKEVKKADLPAGLVK